MQFQSFKCGYPVFPAKFVEDAVFSPSCALGFFVKNQLTASVRVYVWIFNSNALIVFLCQYHADFIVMVLWNILNLENVMPLAFDCITVVFLRIDLDIKELMYFHEFGDWILYLCEECHCDFDRNCTEHIDCFW
jgi:hypothetical protein